MTITAQTTASAKKPHRPDGQAAVPEVLYDVLTALGVKFTADIAESIYIGVSTDTGLL